MKTELALLLTNDGPVMTVEQVADLLRLKPDSLTNKVYEGTCPVPMFKLGSKFFAHVTDVAAYIDAQRADAMELLRHPRKAA